MRVASASGIAGLLIAGAFFAAFALAHDESEGVPVILSPTDGAVVRSPVTMIVEFKGASGARQHHGAHLHLVVDSPLPTPGRMVPMDEKHIHLTHGETKTVLSLAPGKHTLQLIVGGDDHVIRAHAPHSKMITIAVQ